MDKPSNKDWGMVKTTVGLRKSPPTVIDEVVIVPTAKKHTGRYCADCGTIIENDEWACRKCGGCL